MSQFYSVVSSLVFEDTSGQIDFKGCQAQIIGHTSSYVFAEFYEGPTFMISKNEFFKSTEPIQYYHKPDDMETVDVTFWLNGAKIKTFRALWNRNDPEYSRIKKNAEVWFKLVQGVHYDSITTEFFNEVKTNTKIKEQWQNLEYKKEIPSESKADQIMTKAEVEQMEVENFHEEKQPSPKSGTMESEQTKDMFTTTTSYQKQANKMAKKVIKTENIEEAQIVAEITNETNALTVAEKIAQTLPAIPDVFFIDGQEYSVAVVAEMEKQADELLQKATPETYSSKAIWEEVDALQKKLVKMRTTPNNKRLELVKPYQEFVKEIKSKTDAVGDAAKLVQEKLDAALQAKKDHEAELIRQEEEAKRIRTEERRESLRSLGGAYDVNTGTITFDYMPGTVINQMQLMEYDDPTWDNQYNAVLKQHNKEQLRLATLKEQEEEEKKAALRQAEEANQRIVNYRLKELKFEGFDFNEALQAWTKNGVTLHMQAIQNYSDEQWDASILASGQDQAAVASVAPPTSPFTISEPTTTPNENEEPTEAESAPFDPLAAVINGKVEAHNERVAELDGKVVVALTFDKENPFIDVEFRNSLLRIAPFDYAEEALHGVLQEKIVGNVNNDDLKVKFLAIKK